MRTFHNIVDGKPVQASDGRTLDIHDPKTGEVYATSPLSGPADVDAAYAARAAGVPERLGRHHAVGPENALLKFADPVEANAESSSESRRRTPASRWRSRSRRRSARWSTSSASSPARQGIWRAGRPASTCEGHSSSIRREPVGVIGRWRRGTTR